MLAAALAAGCQNRVDEIEGVFYDGDHRSVHCAINLDTVASNSLASIDSALDRAVARGETVELYAHIPGVTVPISVIEHVLDGALARGLAFVTYADFAHGAGTGPGLALSFDDSAVSEWFELRPAFEAREARVTLFITRYAYLSDENRAKLKVLADDGHDIAAHSVDHMRAPEYVENHGLGAYLAAEVVPSIEILRDDGYDITSFAYPYGARTGELDRAVLEHVPILRSVAFSYTGLVTSPCPE